MVRTRAVAADTVLLACACACAGLRPLGPTQAVRYDELSVYGVVG